MAMRVQHTIADSPLTHGVCTQQNWLTTEQLDEMVNPPSYVRSYVRDWATESGAVLVQDLGHAFVFEATVAVVERMFNTEMHAFEHTATGKRILCQWGEFSLPAHVSAHIDLVLGMSEFPLPARTVMRASNATGVLDPTTYYKQYNFPSSPSGAGASQGVAQWEASATHTHCTTQHPMCRWDTSDHLA